MDEELISVKVLMKSGQTSTFNASAVARQAWGYEFLSYPEKRGYKKLISVRDEAVATISIEAPDQFFQALTNQQPVQAAPTPPVSGPPAPYPGGDPRVGAKMAAPVPEAQKAEGKHGIPMAVVKEWDKEGRERSRVVAAGMVAG